MRPFVAILLGSSAGVLAAVLVWKYAQGQLQTQFTEGAATLSSRLGTGSAEMNRRFAEGRARIDALVLAEVMRRVPPEVDTTVRNTLASYGLTPTNSRAVIAQVNRVLAWTGA